jgi:hypothetical protein
MSEKKGKPYDLSNDYKALPVKKRAGLIKIARTLLKLQKENAVVLGDTPPNKKSDKGA